MNAVAIDQTSKGDWTAAHGDCVEVMRAMPAKSVHLTVTSIPFASLFTYSASDRDFGNCSSHADFFGQFKFWVDELLRVTVAGRIAAIHCMILPSSKTRDGVIGLIDFRGQVVRAMQEGGWIFHSETAIWKDPVTAMQRTKALGLLHKQIKKDSCMSRTGILDYLCAFRAPGKNPEPVTHTNESFPVAKWQQVASPVWMDINQQDTLNGRSAREDEDERHICPLQIEVIERCIDLWSNPGDVVLDPFGGIGSTGVVALKAGRRAAICELKESYYRQAVANLGNAKSQFSMFDVAEEPEEDPMRIAELEKQVSEVQRTLTERDGDVASLGDKIRTKDEEIGDLEEEIEELEKEVEEYERVEQEPLDVASVHDFMRDKGLIKDPALDVPFHVTPTVWQTELERACEGNS